MKGANLHLLRKLMKMLLEKERTPHASLFLLSHNVFYPFKVKLHPLGNYNLSSAYAFDKDRSKNCGEEISCEEIDKISHGNIFFPMDKLILPAATQSCLLMTLIDKKLLKLS